MFRKIILLFLLFCYVFAFYLGPFSVSLLISIPLYFYCLLDRKFLLEVYAVINTKLLKSCLKAWFFIVILALLFPILYLTFSYSFFKVVGMQGAHFIAAIPFFAYLKYTKVSFDELERCYVYIFVIQTFIQLIVLNNAYLGEKILLFNHFEVDKAVGLGANIRGKALSAATTYHLTMAYGFCFIIYLKRYLSIAITLKNILIGILIFVGIFCAGRSGFVACLIGIIGFLFYKNGIVRNFYILLKATMLVMILLLILSAILINLFPDFWTKLNEQVLPYAFEFLYSLDNSGKMETASTNHLTAMWMDRDFNMWELVFGSGKYTNPDGSSYMHVDPGVLRHLLFMGVLGYLILYIYQLCLFPIWKMKGDTKYYYSLIFLFLAIMDFKGINIGLNKFAFAITLLLSYGYFYLQHDKQLK